MQSLIFAYYIQLASYNDPLTKFNKFFFYILDLIMFTDSKQKLFFYEIFVQTSPLAGSVYMANYTINYVANYENDLWL